MGQEHEQILRMVASGRLSSEQADQLLEALGAPGQAQSAERSGARQPRGRPRLAIEQGKTARFELVSQLTALGASISYMKELRDAGLMDEVPHDLLVSLTAVRKKDVAYLRALRDEGFMQDLPHDLLISLTAVQGDIAYLRELRDLGLIDLPHDLLTSLVAVGAKATNIREMRDMGLTDLPHDLLVPLVAHGATPTYIKELRDAGLVEFASEDERKAKGSEAGWNVAGDQEPGGDTMTRNTVTGAPWTAQG